MLEKLARDKRSSLLRILINYDGKKFYNFDDRFSRIVPVYKTISPRRSVLKMFLAYFLMNEPMNAPVNE
jgi:hypothetical protein